MVRANISVSVLAKILAGRIYRYWYWLDQYQSNPTTYNGHSFPCNAHKPALILAPANEITSSRSHDWKRPMIEDNGSYAQNQRNDSHIWNNLTRIKMGLNIYMGFYIQKLLKIFNTYWLMLPVSTCVVSSQNIHNNNGVCVATANQTRLIYYYVTANFLIFLRSSSFFVILF